MVCLIILLTTLSYVKHLRTQVTRPIIRGARKDGLVGTRKNESEFKLVLPITFFYWQPSRCIVYMCVWIFGNRTIYIYIYTILFLFLSLSLSLSLSHTHTHTHIYIYIYIYECVHDSRVVYLWIKKTQWSVKKSSSPFTAFIRVSVLLSLSTKRNKRTTAVVASLFTVKLIFKIVLSFDVKKVYPPSMHSFFFIYFFFFLISNKRKLLSWDKYDDISAEVFPFTGK